MTVLLEFTIDTDEFVLGRVLGETPGTRLELERVVPTGGQVMPFVWATGGDHGALETSVRAHPEVAALLEQDRVGDEALYRIEWADPPTELMRVLVETEGTVLEAKGDAEWRFRLRFPDQSHLTEFHNCCAERGIDITVKRTYPLASHPAGARGYDITKDQREALVLALREGYFAIPRKCSLEELADKLGISSQAVSERIRRATEQVLAESLLQPAAVK